MNLKSMLLAAAEAQADKVKDDMMSQINSKEMEEKIPNFRNPQKYISQRIENEIRETDQKYRLFVR